MARPAASADPARFSLAHGGKDRHPYPVPIKVYDQTIAVLKRRSRKAKLGNDERARGDPAAGRAGAPARAAGHRPVAPALIAEESARSHDYGGRSVFGWEPPPAAAKDA